MADEQQRQQQALSAFSLLVDAANAQQLRSGGIVESNAVAASASPNASAPTPNKVSSANGNNNYYNNPFGGSAAGISLEERIAAIRQAALSTAYPQFQQQQQQQLQLMSDSNGGAAAVASRNLDAMEIQEALQRELLHREALRRQQATALMGLSGGAVGSGSGLVGLGGSNNSYASAAQEAEYLQQLRLEALVQQRRQETLAQLALAQELGMSPDMQAMLEAEQLRQVLMLRQEALLANSAAAAAAAASNNGSGVFGGVESILAALQGGGGGGGGITEDGVLQILQERDRQQKLSLLLQAQQQQMLPQHVGSSQAIATSQGHNLERADLIGSVFAKSHTTTAAAATISATEERGRMQTLQQQLASASAAKGPSSTQAEQQSHHATAFQGQDRSKTTILPCRARAMPMDHNVKTAYFVIPEDVKHGTELYCSYLDCRNDGIKFRYCVYCKLPVAKRNFAKRHRHTGKISASDLPGDFEEISEADGFSSSERGSAGVFSPHLEKAATVPPVAKPDPQNPIQWEAKELLDMLLARNVQELQSDGSTVANNNKTPIGSEMLEQLIRKKQGEWDKLLMDRPRTSNDSAAMATWLLEVLRVSDVDKSVAAVTSVAAGDVNTAPPTPSTGKVMSKVKNPGSKKKKRKLVLKAAKPAKEDKPKKKKEGDAKPKPNQEKVSSVSESNAPSVTEAPAVMEPKENTKPVPDMEAGNEDTDLEEDENHKSHDELPATADDSSTSSEDSVDLRASKKART